MDGFKGAANLEIFLNKLSPRFMQIFVVTGGDFQGHSVTGVDVDDVEKLDLLLNAVEFRDGERKLKEFNLFDPLFKTNES